MSFLGDFVLLRELRRTNQLLELIMAKIDELNAKVQELATAVETERGEVRGAVDELAAEIARLQGLVGTGGTSDVEIQASIDALEAVRASLTTIVDRPAPA